MSTETITVRLTPGEVARVDEMRGEGVSRSAFVRELLRRAGPVDEAPTYGEALELPARRARAGKVQAQVAPERPSDAGGVVRGRLLTVRARAADAGEDTLRLPARPAPAVRMPLDQACGVPEGPAAAAPTAPAAGARTPAAAGHDAAASAGTDARALRLAGGPLRRLRLRHTPFEQSMLERV
jgi:Arc/MetJ-type ribon-helix-helix transcriptional regulator